MNNELQQLLSELHEQWRFPGTVYDTFSALIEIAQRDKTLLYGEPLGKITQILTSIESRPGGPYYSYFPEKGKACPKIFDHQTNDAIDRFLALYDVELPKLREFLHKEERSVMPDESATSKTWTSAEQKLLGKIRRAIGKRLQAFDPEFRTLAKEVIERTIRGNSDKQMTLMPFFMRAALGKRGARISEKTLINMCVANIFFWTAFIIYDDFWDEDEAARPALLPIANMFARTYSSFFSALLPARSGFEPFFQGLMDKLDEANAWETRHCRMSREDGMVEIPKCLPNYGTYVKKFRPASGHVLGPVAMLVLVGYKIDSAEVQHLIDYFQNYLIAMQMNDDMHDWEEDLRRGHISTVVDVLLRDINQKWQIIDLCANIEELREVFWFKTLPKVAARVKTYTKKARAALGKLTSITDPAPLALFIDMNECIAEKALAEQQQSVEFIRAYGQG